MSWNSPRTWVAGEIVTAALMNTHVRDNLRYGKGLDGVPTIESGLTIDNTDGDERLLLPLLSTAEIATVLNAEGEVAFDEQTHQMKAYDGTAVRTVTTSADIFVSSGSYTGNNTASRAIAHGLGHTPSIVLIKTWVGVPWFRIFGAVAQISYVTPGSQGQWAVTIPDTTNFYVGNASNYLWSANDENYTFSWVAI